MTIRIPHPENPTEVRKAFQHLEAQGAVLGTGTSGYLLVAQGEGVAPVWQTIVSTIDHGSIGGLDDDDHALYHTDARGDARYYTETEMNAGQMDTRYYTETELNAGQLDTRYFTEAEHLSSSAGAADAGKPIKLNASGYVDATMMNGIYIDHGALSGLDDADHDAVYYQESEHINSSAGAGDAGKPVVLDADGHLDATMLNDADVDHGGTGGLGDDDHTIYLLAAGTRNLAGNLTVDAGITIDGRDISADGTVLDAIAAIAARVGVDSGAIPGYLGAAFNDGVLRTSTGISYADGGNFVTLTTNDGEIVHDSLSGYDANDHIDHTTITLTAGSGIAGGGTIAANRSFDLDINSLAAAGIAAGDFIPFWDITATATNKKILFSGFEAALNHDALTNYDANKHVDHTGVSITTAANSGLAGGGTIASTRVLVLDINNLTAIGIAAGDFLAFWDITATAATKKITFANFEGTLAHNNLSGYDAAKHVTLPGTIANVLTDHDLAAHEALGLGETIITNTTFYIATTGNDSTGDGTSGTPWLTLNKALTHLSDKIIGGAATVTIEFADGAYTVASTDTIDHANGNKINIVGENTYSLTLSSIQSSGGASGAWSIVINVDDVSNAAVDDFLLVPYNVTGGTRPETLCGCWKITNVDVPNTRLTITSIHQHTSAPSGAVSGTVVLVKTIFYSTGNYCITVAGKCQLGLVNKLVFEGDAIGTNRGLLLSDGAMATCGPDVGFNNFQIGIQLSLESYLEANYVKVSGCTLYSLYIYYASLSMRYSVLSGNVNASLTLGSLILNGSVVSGNTTGLTLTGITLSIVTNSKVTYTTGTGIVATMGSIVDSLTCTYAGNGTDTSPLLNTEGGILSYIRN